MPVYPNKKRQLPLPFLIACKVDPGAASGGLSVRTVITLRMNGPFDGTDRAVDVTIGAGLKPLRECIVFVVADVLARLPEKVEGVVMVIA